MAADEYKGGIAHGAITAKFQADYSNGGSALLYISYAETGGANPQVSHAAVVPGGSQTVAVNTTVPGVLEVWVAVGQSDDSGRLVVTTGATTADDEPVQGAVSWGYSVV
jgi:hypothetical protein